MNKKLLFITSIVLLISTHSFCQKVNNISLKELDTEYIEVVCLDEIIGQLTVLVDYGQKDNSWNDKTSKLKGADGKNLKFNSMIATLNFFHTYGYELFNTYVLKPEEDTNVHCILKKKR